MGCHGRKSFAIAALFEKRQRQVGTLRFLLRLKLLGKLLKLMLLLYAMLGAALLKQLLLKTLELRLLRFNLAPHGLDLRLLFR